MGFLKKSLYSILIIFLILPCAIAYSEDDAEIKNLILTRKNSDSFISFSVENAFSEDVKKIIQSGIPVTFSFDIEVVKKRFLLPDKTLLDLEIIHKLKYSSLTKTYFIKKPYISQEPFLIHSEKRAKSEMTSITDLKIDIPEFEKGAEYEVSARARLREITLPFYLHKIFFFLSVWDFKTDWHSVEIKF